MSPRDPTEGVHQLSLGMQAKTAGDTQWHSMASNNTLTYRLNDLMSAKCERVRQVWQFAKVLSVSRLSQFATGMRICGHVSTCGHPVVTLWTPWRHIIESFELIIVWEREITEAKCCRLALKVSIESILLNGVNSNVFVQTGRQHYRQFDCIPGVHRIPQCVAFMVRIVS